MKGLNYFSRAYDVWRAGHGATTGTRGSPRTTVRHQRNLDSKLGGRANYLSPIIL